MKCSKSYITTNALYGHTPIRPHILRAVSWQRTRSLWRCCVVIVIMVALSRVFYSTCKVLEVIWNVLSALRNQVVGCDCGLAGRAGVLQPSAWNLCTAASRPLEVVSDHPRAWGRGEGASPALIGSSASHQPSRGAHLWGRDAPRGQLRHGRRHLWAEQDGGGRRRAIRSVANVEVWGGDSDSPWELVLWHAGVFGSALRHHCSHQPARARVAIERIHEPVCGNPAPVQPDGAASRPSKPQ